MVIVWKWEGNVGVDDSSKSPKCAHASHAISVQTEQTEMKEVTEKTEGFTRPADLPAEKALDVVKQGSDVSPKLVQTLMAKIPPEVITKKLKELLEAKTPVRIGKGGDEYGGEPDYRAMEAGLKLWLAYCEGLPVQRQHIIQETLETDSQTFARLKESPAALALMLGKLGVPADVIREMTADQPVIEAETLGESSKE